MDFPAFALATVFRGDMPGTATLVPRGDFREAWLRAMGLEQPQALRLPWSKEESNEDPDARMPEIPFALPACPPFACAPVAAGPTGERQDSQPVRTVDIRSESVELALAGYSAAMDFQPGATQHIFLTDRPSPERANGLPGCPEWQTQLPAQTTSAPRLPDLGPVVRATEADVSMARPQAVRVGMLLTSAPQSTDLETFVFKTGANVRTDEPQAVRVGTLLTSASKSTDLETPMRQIDANVPTAQPQMVSVKPKPGIAGVQRQADPDPVFLEAVTTPLARSTFPVPQAASPSGRGFVAAAEVEPMPQDTDRPSQPTIQLAPFQTGWIQQQRAVSVPTFLGQAMVETIPGLERSAFADAIADADRAGQRVIPEAASAPFEELAPVTASRTFARLDLRLHAEWTPGGASIWLGMDAREPEFERRLGLIAVELKRALGTRGDRLTSLICNGRTIVADAGAAKDNDAPDDIEWPGEGGESARPPLGQAVAARPGFR